MKIDILVAKNPYSSTSYFAKSLDEALKRKGVLTRRFWIDEGFFYDLFPSIADNPPDLTCSFSDIRLGMTPLGDLLQLPHLSLLLDPAIYFLHHCKSPFSWISCVDEEDVAFLHALHFPKAFFLPHCADIKDFTPVEKERIYEGVFFGSCTDYEKIEGEWVERYPKKTQILLQEASRAVLSIKTLTILKALSNLDVQEEDLPLFHHEVDRWTRSYARIDQLKNKEIHIWGKGPWKKFCPKAICHPSVTFKETLKIMKESKFVFNSSPRFKFGSHERILTALMCGACPVTAQNGFTEKFFQKDELLTYPLGDDDFLMDENLWSQIALKGQKRVLEEHTWDCRVDTLLNTMLFFGKGG